MSYFHLSRMSWTGSLKAFLSKIPATVYRWKLAYFSRLAFLLQQIWETNVPFLDPTATEVNTLKEDPIYVLGQEYVRNSLGSNYVMKSLWVLFYELWISTVRYSRIRLSICYRNRFSILNFLEIIKYVQKKMRKIVTKPTETGLRMNEKFQIVGRVFV